jgi:hypothetical protein
MWNKEIFEYLTTKIDLGIKIDWNKKPSSEKYGNVISLLTLISILTERSALFLGSNGKKIDSIHIKQIYRKLTDTKKQHFTIVGHDTNQPIVFAQDGKLLFEIFFNNHLLVETETTYRQYYPSASTIVRCRNLLTTSCVPSPGSWGSDIIGMTFDWPGTFIFESSEFEIPKKYRKNFKGFKYIPSKYKYLLTSRVLPKNELKFLKNNGFENPIIATRSQNTINRIKHRFFKYLEEQQMRCA